MRIALKLDDLAKQQEIFETCPDPLIKMQLAFQLGRQRQFFEDCPDEYKEASWN